MAADRIEALLQLLLDQVSQLIDENDDRKKELTELKRIALVHNGVLTEFMRRVQALERSFRQ